MDDGQANLCKVFIGGISWTTSLDALREHFSEYGDVVDAVILRDKQTGKSRGFGFVTFASPASVDKVMDDNDQGLIQLDGRTVEAKRAIPKGLVPSGPRTKKVFVGGLPHSLSDEDFRQYFEQFGVVTESQILLDKETSRPRGFGFITFDSEETVDEIVGKPHEIGGKIVEVKKAEPKVPRSAAYSAADYGNPALAPAASYGHAPYYAPSPATPPSGAFAAGASAASGLLGGTSLNANPYSSSPYSHAPVHHHSGAPPGMDGYSPYAAAGLPSAAGVSAFASPHYAVTAGASADYTPHSIYNSRVSLAVGRSFDHPSEYGELGPSSYSAVAAGYPPHHRSALYGTHPMNMGMGMNMGPTVAPQPSMSSPYHMAGGYSVGPSHSDPAALASFPASTGGAAAVGVMPSGGGAGAGGAVSGGAGYGLGVGPGYGSGGSGGAVRSGSQRGYRPY